jgi:hypothetical protein
VTSTRSLVPSQLGTKRVSVGFRSCVGGSMRDRSSIPRRPSSGVDRNSMRRSPVPEPPKKAVQEAPGASRAAALEQDLG